MDYDKPFKDYNELINIMISRNISIPDPSFAEKVLSDISYYTLVNGYKNTFLAINGSDDFVPGTSFDDLYTLHIIDTNLSSFLLKYILYIERSLKSKISYIVSKNYGVYTDLSNMHTSNPNDYLFRDNYSRSSNRRENILHKIKSAAIDDRNNLSLVHYKNNHNHIPPWILIGNVPYGLSIQWYNILKSHDKDYVCNSMVATSALNQASKKELFKKCLNISKNYRNNLAHGIRTFSSANTIELPKNPLLLSAPALITEVEYLSGFGKNDLYAIIIIICLLINDPYIHTSFISDLHYVFALYIENDIKMCGKTILEIFNLPSDLFTRIENYGKQKYPTINN